MGGVVVVLFFLVGVVVFVGFCGLVFGSIIPPPPLPVSRFFFFFFVFFFVFFFSSSTVQNFTFDVLSRILRRIHYLCIESSFYVRIHGSIYVPFVHLYNSERLYVRVSVCVCVYITNCKESVRVPPPSFEFKFLNAQKKKRRRRKKRMRTTRRDHNTCKSLRMKPLSCSAVTVFVTVLNALTRSPFVSYIAFFEMRLFLN